MADGCHAYRGLDRVTAGGQSAGCRGMPEAGTVGAYGKAGHTAVAAVFDDYADRCIGCCRTVNGDCRILGDVIGQYAGIFADAIDGDSRALVVYCAQRVGVDIAAAVGIAGGYRGRPVCQGAQVEWRQLPAIGVNCCSIANSNHAVRKRYRDGLVIGDVRGAALDYHVIVFGRVQRGVVITVPVKLRGDAHLRRRRVDSQALVGNASVAGIVTTADPHADRATERCRRLHRPDSASLHGCAVSLFVCPVTIVVWVDFQRQRGSGRQVGGAGEQWRGIRRTAAGGNRQQWCSDIHLQRLGIAGRIAGRVGQRRPDRCGAIQSGRWQATANRNRCSGVDRPGSGIDGCAIHQIVTAVVVAIDFERQYGAIRYIGAGAGNGGRRIVCGNRRATAYVDCHRRVDNQFIAA